jgi:ArsR family transcriptional regulator, arsenate/arsenite/antimonite-responsive transcriptional repressor / arsenate reductase (thioredoxin)
MYTRWVQTAAADVSPQAFLQLVADPHRWRLLGELAVSDRRVGELTDILGKPQNLVSYHLGELRRAGLVSARRSSADRRDTYYRADILRCGVLLRSVGAALDPGLRLGPLAAKSGRPKSGRPSRVLFLCTGNSARSQMAEALLEHRSHHAIRASSAGSHPKALHPNAVRVMAEHGIDISRHQTKHLRRLARARFDLVITLCDRVREVCPEFPGRPVAAHWSMPDPAQKGDTDEATYPAFQRTAQELETRIGLLIAHMTTEGGSDER